MREEGPPGSVFFVENSGDVPRLWRKLTSAGPAKAARVCFEVFGLAGVPACRAQLSGSY